MPHSVALVSPRFLKPHMETDTRRSRSPKNSWLMSVRVRTLPGRLSPGQSCDLSFLKNLFKIFTQLFIMCVCTNVYSWTLTCHDVCIEDLRKSVAVVCVCFLYHASLRDRTQVIWFGSRCLYLLNYLPGPHENLNIHLL